MGKRMVWPAVAAIAVVLASLLPTTAATAATGRPHCTIMGTDHADRLVGTRHRDVICAGGGNDVIDGRGGDDVILGGSGDDRIDGGSGNDRIDGGTGKDRIVGGTGGDDVQGGEGADRITGGSGRDRITAGPGADTVDAGAGADTVTAGSGDDRVVGGSGNDRISGDSGDDVLAGGAGDDVLAGGTGDDSISAGAGHDRVVAGSGADRIDPGSGTVTTCTDSYGRAASCHATFDRPGATDITVDRPVIDTGLAAQTVHVRTRVRDDAADVTRADLTVRLSTGGGPTIFTRLTPTSGTARDGWWEGDVVVPKLAPTGDYDLWVSATDAARRSGGGSRQHGQRPGSGDEPGPLRQVGVGDQAAPVFRSIELDRSTVDTSAAAQDIAVRARITDDLLGADAATVELVWTDPRSTNDHPLGQRVTARLGLSEGSRVDGWWTGVLHLPQYSAQGVWTVTASTHDALAFHTVPGTQTEPVAGPTSIQQVGAGDAAAPSVVDVSLSASTVSAASLPASVHVVAHLADDLEVTGGRIRADPDLSDPGAPRPNTECFLHRTAGTASDGTWECDLPVAPGDPVGVYRLIAIVSDVAGNSTYGYLSAFPGWTGPTTLEVTAP